MARRTKEEALETREQLLDAAEQVFRERGVGHASLAEVADAAGVTRGAVYHHFESKAELFQALMARAEMPIDTAFEDFENQDIADPLALFREQGLQALEHLTGNSRVQNVFEVLFLRCEYTDELAAVGEQHVSDRLDCLNKCKAVLDQAVAKGQLPPDTDTHLAAHGAFAFVTGLMRDWVQSPASFDLKAGAPQLIDMYVAGLRANPPRLASSSKRTGND
ncbi:MAG: TetR family transcriptional regulator [Burkholderiaceae bacterium]